MLIPNKHVIFVAANAGRFSICSDFISLRIDCLICPQKLFVPSVDFTMREVQGDEVKVSFVGDQVKIRLILQSCYNFNNLFVIFT